MSLDRQESALLARRLARAVEGEVLFDDLSRGLYSTDASFYQIRPKGVVVPKHHQDVLSAIEIAAEHGVPILPRGAGTSQCGQTVGDALVIDASKYLTAVESFEPEQRAIRVQPGIVLDQLNFFLKPHGLFFPVDVSTSSRATIGGMAGNNSVGARSIRYGHMADNVSGIRAVLADGEDIRFAADPNDSIRHAELVSRMRVLYQREAGEIERRYPKVKRNVAGYNIDRLGRDQINLAELLVGSEGTLAWFREIELKLQPIPAHKVIGVCHFPAFSSAMESAQHLVALGPSAVELIDRTVIELARENPAFRAAIERFVHGEPDALLVVEFAGDNAQEQLRCLERLEEAMADLGFPGGVVRAVEADLQQTVWSVRTAALNIVMSMKGDGKPVSFIEDCAVPLDKLGEYTARITEVFERNGTTGTWYAHASVGCLHVRPILNLKDEQDIAKLRRIAAEAHAMVRQYKGAHSGEHGDGLVRSEFLRPMLGNRIVRAFEEVKEAFDPNCRFNPGKIVNPSNMDDRSLFRFREDYAVQQREYVLDWSEWGGFNRATEMCNNNGACRRFDVGVMCPSYRATRDEQHVTRGRANALRLAVTGQLAPDAFTSREMYQTMDLCVGCKACKRECPTGVDMYRMKIEFLHHYRERWGLSWKDRLIAYLPRYAPWASRLPYLANLPSRAHAVAKLAEARIGFTAKRALPTWRREVFEGRTESGKGREVVLLADTFSTYFEPENARAAEAVLGAAGYRVVTPKPRDGARPLCCGRTFLNVGLIDEAKVEARRVINTLAPYADRGVPIVGLEPSCLLTLRDEFKVILPEADVGAISDRAMLFEEFLSAEHARGRLELPLRELTEHRALVHGHCHQKAFGLMPQVKEVLSWIPAMEVEAIEAGCCGMAGSFGYDVEHYDISMAMAELDLLPVVRRASADTVIIADGTSCREQIHHGAGREAWHSAQVLARALNSDI